MYNVKFRYMSIFFVYNINVSNIQFIKHFMLLRVLNILLYLCMVKLHPFNLTLPYTRIFELNIYLLNFFTDFLTHYIIFVLVYRLVIETFIENETSRFRCRFIYGLFTGKWNLVCSFIMNENYMIYKKYCMDCRTFVILLLVLFLNL